MSDQTPNNPNAPLPGDKIGPTGKRLKGSRWSYFRRELEVEQVHIDYSMPADSHSCMIAEAIKDQIPGARNIVVDIATIRWTDTIKARRIICLTPRKAQTALVQFDQGVKPEPFRFMLEAVQITQTREQIQQDGLFASRVEKAPRPQAQVEGRQPPKETLPRHPSYPASKGSTHPGNRKSALRPRQTNARQLRFDAFKEMGSSLNKIPEGAQTNILNDMVIHGGKEPPIQKTSRKRAFGLKGFSWTKPEDSDRVSGDSPTETN